MTTASAVSRNLKSAGFQMSKVRQGRIASFSTEGVQVRTDYMKRIVVDYIAGEAYTPEASKARQAKRLLKLEELATYLSANGYTVTPSDIFTDALNISK